jgi:hypothetical protein
MDFVDTVAARTLKLQLSPGIAITVSMRPVDSIAGSLKRCELLARMISRAGCGGGLGIVAGDFRCCIMLQMKWLSRFRPTPGSAVHHHIAVLCLTGQGHEQSLLPVLYLKRLLQRFNF